MKKSVLLPYERYQELLKHRREPVETTETQNDSKSIPQTLEIVPPTQKLNSSVIIACLPKRNRSKAQQLLNYIEKQPNLDWNREGNLVVDGNIVDFSHIVDLLHDALNPTKNEPVGYEQFYRNLEHIPHSLINNTRRKTLIGGSAPAPHSLPPPGIPLTDPKPLNIWKTRWKPL